jgi:uncharacterized protein YndB with AHSA1/START domain
MFRDAANTRRIYEEGDGMPDLHFTTTIKGSAETVFALVADFTHYDRWLPGSGSFGTITVTSPLPVGLGTTYVDAGPAGTRYGEVTAYDPPKRICFHQPMNVQRLGTIDIHLCQTFEQMGQMVQVNRDLTIQVRGVLKVAQPLVLSQFRHENARVLLALKHYIEKDPAPDSEK